MALKIKPGKVVEKNKPGEVSANDGELQEFVEATESRFVEIGERLDGLELILTAVCEKLGIAIEKG